MIYFPTKRNVSHVYYMSDRRVMHAWCFSCITQVIHTFVIHVLTHVINKLHKYTCKTGVYPTHVIRVYKYNREL